MEVILKKAYVFKLSFFILIIFSALFMHACNDECTHVNMTDTVIEPTHEEQGYTLRRCSDCEYEYALAYVAPLGHDLQTEVVQPTCSEQGYTHYYCQCGYEYTSDYIEPLGHTLSVETVEPNCDSEGYKIADCGVCGLHYTYDIVAPLGHDLKIDRRFVSASNQSASSTYTCGRCDLNYVGDYVFYHDIYKGAYVDNTEVLAKGIDVSYYQHEQDGNKKWLPLDWNAVRDAGFDYAILRAGYMGTGNVGVTDEVFEMNYTDAKAAGLGVGAYFYSYAYTVEDARAEAEFLLTLLDGKTFEYPIFFDIEYSDTKIAEEGLTPNDLTDICVEFISTLQKNGYYAALYTNNKWLTEHLISEKITTLFDVWYARYLYNAESGITVNEATWNTEKYGQQMAMWQFSETGTIDGIYYKYQKNDDGTPKLVRFDMNYSYKDYPTLIKQLALNGFSLEKDLSNMDGEKQEYTPDTSNTN